MNIVTGYTGSPHVTSNAAQALNQGIFGTGNYVLNVGNKFNAVLTDANTVTISDGEGVLQGVHFRINPGTTETVNISNGTSGYKRIDYICARYTKNALTGVESVDLVVVEGTPDASTPTAPTINTGDILLGSTTVDFPLYEVDLDGLTPTLSRIQTELENESSLGGHIRYYEGIVEDVIAFSNTSQTIKTGITGKCIVLSVMSCPQYPNNNYWSTPYVTNHDGTPYTTCECRVNEYGNLIIRVVNVNSGTTNDIPYRVVTLEFD